MDDIKITYIKVKTVLTKSNLPIAGYSVNPYVGCTHACKYCYACFMKRFTGHDEPWGTFLDVKQWDRIKILKNNTDKRMSEVSERDENNLQEKKFARQPPFLKKLQATGITL